MTKEEIEAFLEKVNEDEVLHEKLHSAADEDSVLSIASQAGFNLTPDLAKGFFLKYVKSDALSEEELEHMSGGAQQQASPNIPQGHLSVGDNGKKFWCP